MSHPLVRLSIFVATLFAAGDPLKGQAPATRSRDAGSSAGSFHGLHLRSHPDADLATSRVYLVHASEIVMDDGTRVEKWRDLEADITTAGAGGLDAGAKAPTAWYEIYAIRKSETGEKTLLLHRTKEYAADSSQARAGGPKGRPLASATPLPLAQQFQLTSGGPIEVVDIMLRRRGIPNGTIWLTIEADEAGQPSGTVLARSDKLNASVMPPEPGFIRFVFRKPTALSAGVSYHMVLRGDYLASSAARIEWSGVASDLYASGAALQQGGAAWSPAVGIADFSFRVFVTRHETPVVLPPGFDQKARIGFVATNRAGQIVGFVAIDRRVMPLSGMGTGPFTNTFPVLFDLGASIPPGAVRVELTAASEIPAARIAAQPVPDGYNSRQRDFARHEGGHTSAVIAMPSAGQSLILGSVITEYQGCYFYTTTVGVARAYVSMWEW